ncbi:hypothetical protein I0C86_27460 [Plantactinospora sp. S1510]|uniref:CHAD domain-containing protein n=1 Tax=Plantactinospora alkalitolerans TaxID=2789879 RepID=A0ABS0H2J0_9ACTN|nr:hypothetical protein [Plantactinospora alkalitolerans]MBF9132664.1 hypothetical protein [Plantactinospora alkalitolerans]
MAVRRAEGHRRLLERVLRAQLESDTETSARLARDVLRVLPELTWYDAARRQCVIAKILVVRLTERLAAQPEIHLPPPGTTLTEALYAEVEALRSHRESGTGPGGTYMAGHQAGWERFLDRLRSRADHLARLGEDRARPAVDAQPPSERALNEAAVRLVDAAAALPSWRGRVTSVLVQSHEDLTPVKRPPSPPRPRQRNRRDNAHLLAAELLAVLPGPQNFQAARDCLTETGDRLRELRVRLVERRGGGGTTVDDRRWLNSLAAELRRLADMATIGSGGEAFVAGYTMAGHLFAERLQARADEVAAPQRWIVWRADQDRWMDTVEVAQTDSEADAKAVVATMRHRGDEGRYEISDWN